VRLALLLGAAGLTPPAIILGQALPPPYDVLVTYGPLGIFSVLYITGQVATKRELERANARADRAEQQRDDLANRALTDLVPLVTEVSRTMVPSLDRLVTEVQRMGDRLDRHTGRGD
jgi:hypothetical protein